MSWETMTMEAMGMSYVILICVAIAFFVVGAQADE